MALQYIYVCGGFKLNFLRLHCIQFDRKFRMLRNSVRIGNQPIRIVDGISVMALEYIYVCGGFKLNFLRLHCI